MNELVTIIGSSYFGPIALLFGEMDEHVAPTGSAVQTSPHENGYAVSACILAVACLESYAMRARYLHNAAKLKLKEKKTVLQHLMAQYPDFPFKDELMDLFILRDLLVHNHLWEIEYSWNDEPGLIQHSINKRTSGDGKYKHHIDSDRQTTKKLGLHVNPILVGRSDARTVLCVVWKTLKFLEEKNPNQCYVSHMPILYRGKSGVLSELMEKLCGNT